PSQTVGLLQGQWVGTGFLLLCLELSLVRGISSGALLQSASCSISLATEECEQCPRIALKSPNASVMALVNISNSCNQTRPHPAMGGNLSTKACTSPNENGTYLVCPNNNVNNGSWCFGGLPLASSRHSVCPSKILLWFSCHLSGRFLIQIIRF
ncbi:hypothetical protein GOODEAATRI_033060, partial [Goodea atripinnis]